MTRSIASSGSAQLAEDIGDRLRRLRRGSRAPPGSALVIGVSIPGAWLWVALRRPRYAALDALLVAVAVSLLVNDAPREVSRGSAPSPRWPCASGTRLGRTSRVDSPRVRRAGLIVLFATLLVGCGGEETRLADRAGRGTAAQGGGRGDRDGGEGARRVRNTPGGLFAGLRRLPHVQGGGHQRQDGPGPRQEPPGQGRGLHPGVDRRSNAKIAAGFGPGIMPRAYGETLDSKQVADLVAFLSQQG